MITSDGWFDWAIRLPRNDGAKRTNDGINPVKGVFMHSAEGYKTTLLRLATTGPLSWHCSNMMDGEFYQHWPLTARCWHATAANDEYVGIENEGRFKDADGVIHEASLNAAQIANGKRALADLSAWKGWPLTRPTSPTDKTHTCWEHNEVTRLGGSGSECPSGRIPWAKLMEEDLTDEEKRQLEDREGSVVEAWGRVTEWNYRVDKINKLLIAYDPVIGIIAGTIKYKGEPPI